MVISPKLFFFEYVGQQIMSVGIPPGILKKIIWCLNNPDCAIFVLKFERDLKQTINAKMSIKCVYSGNWVAEFEVGNKLERWKRT